MYNKNFKKLKFLPFYFIFFPFLHFSAISDFFALKPAKTPACNNQAFEMAPGGVNVPRGPGNRADDAKDQMSRGRNEKMLLTTPQTLGWEVNRASPTKPPGETDTRKKPPTSQITSGSFRSRGIGPSLPTGPEGGPQK